MSLLDLLNEPTPPVINKYYTGSRYMVCYKNEKDVSHVSFEHDFQIEYHKKLYDRVEVFDTKSYWEAFHEGRFELGR